MGRLSPGDVDELLDTYLSRGISSGIETGTCQGIQTQNFANSKLETIHTIELSMDLYLRASKKKYANSGKIVFHHGDSAKLLPELCRELYPQDPLLIYLDAHYCTVPGDEAAESFPLWEELEFVSNRLRGDLLVVDDLHTFGKDRPDLKTDVWKQVTVRSVCDAVGGGREVRKYKDHLIFYL
jgi:hypothetical protein